MTASRAASPPSGCVNLNSAVVGVMAAARDSLTWGNPPMTKRIHHTSSRC